MTKTYSCTVAAANLYVSPAQRGKTTISVAGKIGEHTLKLLQDSICLAAAARELWKKGMPPVAFRAWLISGTSDGAKSRPERIKKSPSTARVERHTAESLQEAPGLGDSFVGVRDGRNRNRSMRRGKGCSAAHQRLYGSSLSAAHPIQPLNRKGTDVHGWTILGAGWIPRSFNPFAFSTSCPRSGTLQWALCVPERWPFLRCVGEGVLGGTRQRLRTRNGRPGPRGRNARARGRSKAVLEQRNDNTPRIEGKERRK